MKTTTMAYPAEIRYSPSGLQSRLLTGPLCPVIAWLSPQTSSATFSGVLVQCHRRHPPDHPQANASSPPRAHRPPTNPPNRCPPTSPKRCRLIQMEVEPFSEEDLISVGDHNIKDESVDVDKSVGVRLGVDGRHERDVTPASCPMRRASNVMEYCAEL